MKIINHCVVCGNEITNSQRTNTCCKAHEKIYKKVYNLIYGNLYRRFHGH